MTYAKDARPGTRVRVSACSGCDSGKVGVIVPWSAVQTDGRGVPTNIAGAYRPVDRKAERPVKLDSGELILMYRNRLTKEG